MGLGIFILGMILLPILIGIIMSIIGGLIFIISKGKRKSGSTLMIVGMFLVISTIVSVAGICISARREENKKYNDAPNKIQLDISSDGKKSFIIDGKKYILADFLNVTNGSKNEKEAGYTIVSNRSSYSPLYSIDLYIPFDLYYTSQADSNSPFCEENVYDELYDYCTNKWMYRKNVKPENGTEISVEFDVKTFIELCSNYHSYNNDKIVELPGVDTFQLSAKSYNGYVYYWKYFAKYNGKWYCLERIYKDNQAGYELSDKESRFIESILGIYAHN